MFASQYHQQQRRRRTAAGGVFIIFTTLISSAQAQAADDDDDSSYGSLSSSTTGYTNPEADPVLLNDGNISVTTPAQALIACDDTPTIRWAWSGDDTAAYYHRVDIYTFSTTLASALDPTTLEASLVAGTPLPTGLTLISPTRGLRLSDEEYRWRPVNVPADSYTIYVIVRDRPTKFGQSGIFTVDTGDDTSCILAPGVIAPTTTSTSSRPTIRPTSTTRNSTTARPTNTTSGSNAGSSGSSSNSGTIAAAVAVPIIVILAAIAAFIFYRRKKRSKLANSNNRYANVSSNGGSGSGGGGGGLEKQEEMLPIAHSHAQRTFDSPSPVEQRGGGGGGGWASKFAGGRNKNIGTGAAAAAGVAAVGGTGAALLANQRRSDDEEKYTDKPAAPATHEVAVEEPELFNDYQVAAAAAAAGGAEEGSSPTSEGEPGGRRPVIPALSGWYLDREAQKEVPSLPPTADEMVHTDGEEGGADDEDAEENEEEDEAPHHHQAEVDDLNRRLSQLPPGSTAAAIAAAAAASRTLPTTPAPASPAFGNAQLPAPQTLFGSSGPRSRPPSAYNNPGMGMASLGMGGPASASTSTSSLKNPAAAGGGGASPPSGENHVRPTSRAHRRTNSGMAGVGALYAGESGVPAAGETNNLAPPPPSAALMAGPSSRSSSSIPALGTFPVGVSFSPGQIVSFGGGAGNGPRSMAGVGAGRASGGVGTASSPPSAFSPNATGTQSGQPARPPTPTRMMPSGSGGAGGGNGFVPPVGTLAGRYPSWYGGNAAGDDVQQSPPSRPGSSSGASSPRIGTMSPFGDQHRTRT
ncbi:hypothetical protein CF319_g6546 [Tilletia indica]|nr:hypothetical protein CF319_g6546 [Tilletia indica]